MKHLNDEQLEDGLRRKLTPRRAGWEADRNVLESILLKDVGEVKRQRFAGSLRNAWIATMGLAAALILTFVYFMGLREPGKGDGQGTLSPIRMSPDSHVASIPAVLNLRSVSARKELVSMEDKGWVRRDADSVTREYSYEYIDTVDLVNEEDGTVVRVEIPRQEIVNITYQVI